MLAHQAAQRPDKVFFQYATERSYTFAEMETVSNRIAGGLRRLGVEKGDRVGLILPNGPEFVPIWFGTSKLGAVEVPINHDLKGDLLAYVLENSGSDVLVCHARFLRNLAPLLDKGRKPKAIVVVGTTGANAQALRASPRTWA